MKLRFYLKILRSYARMRLLENTAYPLTFFLFIAGKVARLGIVLLFFSAIFLNVTEIGGFSLTEVMLIYATFSLLEFLVSITFERSLMHYLPLELRDGTFDFALVRPLSPLFYIAFGAIDFFDIFSMIPTIVLIGYVFATAPPTPAGLLWYLIFIGVAYFFVFAVMILISVSAFWTTRTSGLGRLFEYTRQTTRFPLTTFPRAAQFTLFYIFPVALISLVPALAYLGRLSLSNGFYLVIFTAVIFAVSLRVWRWGLRRYESASS